MGKSSPSAPAAPDPVKTANAQTASNIDTANAQAALNHSNQITPWGSQIWTQGPKNADGTSAWTSTITLDPDQQKLLSSNNQISQLLANLGIQQAGNVAGAINKPVDFGAAPAIQNGALSYHANQGGITNTIGNAGPIQNRIVDGGQIQTNVDTSGVPSLVGGDALNDAAKRNQAAAFAQQSAYLDPQYKQQQSDLENKLVQQGVTQNSDAWNRAMEGLARQKTFDYNNAYNNSFATGLAANNQLYNQGLSSNQNAYSQALNNANFANSAQQQQFGQNAAQAALANSAQAQQYGQNSNDAVFANNAQNQGFSQGLANSQLNNQSASQAFQQSLAARNQNLTEQQQAQQIPINLLNALRSGSQITSPTFGSSPQGNIANTDIASMYNTQYQGAIADQNAKVATNNSNTQAGLSAAAMAAMYFF